MLNTKLPPIDPLQEQDSNHQQQVVQDQHLKTNNNNNDSKSLTSTDFQSATNGTGAFSGNKMTPNDFTASFNNTACNSSNRQTLEDFIGHPYFALLRDLSTACQYFDSPSLPGEMLFNLPTDVNMLLYNFCIRNKLEYPSYTDDRVRDQKVYLHITNIHQMLTQKIQHRKQQNHANNNNNNNIQNAMNRAYSTTNLNRQFSQATAVPTHMQLNSNGNGAGTDVNSNHNNNNNNRPMPNFSSMHDNNNTNNGSNNSMRGTPSNILSPNGNSYMSNGSGRSPSPFSPHYPNGQVNSPLTGSNTGQSRFFTISPTIGVQNSAGIVGGAFQNNQSILIFLVIIIWISYLIFLSIHNNFGNWLGEKTFAASIVEYFDNF